MDQFDTINPNAFVIANRQGYSRWDLDLGATSYLTNDLNQFITYQPYSGTHQISITNGKLLPIVQTGKVILPIPNHKFLL